jgi:hypothetical protein
VHSNRIQHSRSLLDTELDKNTNGLLGEIDELDGFKLHREYNHWARRCTDETHLLAESWCAHSHLRSGMGHCFKEVCKGATSNDGLRGKAQSMLAWRY